MEYLESTPYSIKFFAAKSKTGMLSIHVRLILDRMKSEFKTGLTCSEQDWNAAESRFIDNKPYNKYLNNQLAVIEGKIHGSYSKVRSLGVKPTSANIKDVFNGIESEIGSPIILEYIKHFIEVSQMETDRYTNGTIAHYITLKRYLSEYLKIDGDVNMRMNEWRRKHFLHFQSYLLTTKHPILKQPISRATANKYLSKLKVIFNHALSNEIISFDPCKGFTMHRVVGNRQYLTSDEIKRIEQHELANNASLNRVRWIFLFSVYSGLRFSDAINLKKSSIKLESDGKFYIEIIQQKTSEPLYRPLLNKAVQILEKLAEEDPDSEFAIPRISNQKTNSYLKVIADLCEIHKPLSHHVARHSYATSVLLDAGVDLKTVSYFMGHSSIKTTEIYGKITKNRAVDVVNELDKRIG